MKRDLRQIQAIAREFGMGHVERREFGDYLEDCKRRGERGTGNNGDFTYEEMRQKASELREENS
jgi:hypothetical protein